MATSIVAGRYRLLRELGRGGMATVYLAEDEKHRRQVALKVLRPDLAALVGPERFLREIEITASLNHPHILPLLDSGADPGGPLFYVMPYVAGGSLRLLLAAGAVPLPAVVRVVREVASALDYAHARGVIHRDIKPENILFSEGLAVVADFGIARAVSGVAAGRMTGTGLAVGTLGYMSPEQAMGTVELDGRTDVYSLGCVVYELLTGATPAAWPGAEEVQLGRFDDLPQSHRERLDALPGRVEQVLVRALTLRPQHRVATPGELAEELADATATTTRFGEEQVQELLRLAAELQAREPETPAGGGLTIGAVEQIAAQVGIPPVHVREAARALQRAPSTVPARAAPPPLPQQRPRWDRLVETATVPGEVGDDVYPAMVEEIERHLGIVGHATIVGSTLTWSPATQGEESRKVVVQVAARDGRTNIRIQENLEMEGVRKLAIPAGALTFGGLAVVLVQGLGLGEPAGPLLAALLAGAGIFTAIRAVVGNDAIIREPQHRRLVAALARLARAALGLEPEPEDGELPAA